MKLSRPIVTIDLESTGVDPVSDRIIEFGAVVLSPDGTRTEWSRRFNPGMPIPPQATEIHGITDADVAECDPFSKWAKGIWTALQDRDIAGYSLWSLDLPLLDEEFRRCGLKLDLTGVQVIDAGGIFMNKERRRLEDAVLKYCGRSHEGAHGALPDASATLDVLHAQLEVYPDLGEMDLASLATFSRRNAEDGRQPVDLAGKLYRDKEGFVRYGFGKARDKRVADDMGFGYWMLRQDNPGFPGSTCDALQAEFDRLEAQCTATT